MPETQRSARAARGCSPARENLGDVEYRVHGSGVNGAGRNWVAAVEWSF